ncbi:MAG: right-handed parallel beta-helix repeat-containing protein [Verrucomicrobia bacterium]|nr:right-handed parallel beta-helix repeat-containing protein [Verrucomicrobiota bacterium]
MSKLMALTRPLFRRLTAVAGTGLLALATSLAAAPGVFNVRDHGARGDGLEHDTIAINAAINACADAGGGQVLFPPGRYLSGTVQLKSRVTLYFDAGATLVGTTNLSHYLEPTPPDFMPEAKWGKWHRGLIIGENLEDVTLAGPGRIDGNRVFDPTGEERMRGPHTLAFVNCRRLVVRDLTFVDSANYAIFFQVSDDIDIRNVTFLGGWDGVHFRGAPDRPCRNVQITDCRFYTGDDAIAGRYWENTVVSGCIINSACNGIRLIGPARRLTIHDTLFLGPGVHPHRTSKRYNMLTGILLQPGAWDATQGLLDDVLISDVTMHKIASPLGIWLQPGNTAGRITVNGLTATGIYRAAASLESYAETPITNMVFRNVSLEFIGGGTAEQAQTPATAPGVDARPLPAWGLYARNVERLSLESVRLTCATDDLRPVMMATEVQRINFSDFRFTEVPAVKEPIVLTNVTAFDRKGGDPITR